MEYTKNCPHKWYYSIEACECDGGIIWKKVEMQVFVLEIKSWIISDSISSFPSVWLSPNITLFRSIVGSFICEKIYKYCCKKKFESHKWLSFFLYEEIFWIESRFVKIPQYFIAIYDKIINLITIHNLRNSLGNSRNQFIDFKNTQSIRKKFSLSLRHVLSNW